MTIASESVTWATCVRRTLKPNGSTGYRCAAEPVDAFIRKGGALEATDGSTCLCNGLMATCGLGQYRSDGRREPPIVTSGDYLNDIRELLVDRESYSARDVIAPPERRRRRDAGERRLENSLVSRDDPRDVTE
jgi:hypothetical protein